MLENLGPEKPKPTRRSRRLALYSLIMTFTCILLLAMTVTLAIRKARVDRQNEIQSEYIRSLSENMLSIEDEDAELAERNKELEKLNRVLNETSTGALFKAKLKELAESGYSTIQMLKYFFPDKLVLMDKGDYYFFDILESLKKNNYKDELFYRTENGEMQYRENSQDTGIKGIDVSQYNGIIDWERVAATGVRFAYIRCGIRGYSTGKLAEDDGFAYNVDAANAAGIQVGVYFFTQAVTEDEAREEAEFVLERIKDKNTPCPVAIDVEQVDSAESTPRTAALNQEQYTKNVVAFCERIKEEGYTPIIYGNIKTFLLLLDMNKLEDYEKWFAGYISEDVITPYFPYKFRIWQYRSDGSVDGITGNCDMNLAFY